MVEAQIHLVAAEEHRILEVEEERRHLQGEVEGGRQMVILLRCPYLCCVCTRNVNRETKGLSMKELKTDRGKKKGGRASIYTGGNETTSAIT